MRLWLWLPYLARIVIWMVAAMGLLWVAERLGDATQSHVPMIVVILAVPFVSGEIARQHLRERRRR
jgi:hypothetical protein